LARLPWRRAARLNRGVKKGDPDHVVAYSQSLAGRSRALALIKKHGGPLYEAAADASDFIVERLPDKLVRRGRWLNGRFVAVGE
jgi:hypothetical protein